MVLEKIQNRWTNVKEQFQLSASQSSTPPITDQLVTKAYKATRDEWSVRHPGQPLCGPLLTLEVNRKLLTFLNNCPANTRIAIGQLLSKDAVHTRAMEDMGDAISAGKYPSTDMLAEAVITIAEKAPPSNHRDVPPNVLIAGILVPLPLAREMKLQLMHTLIPDWQDGYSSDEESLQGPTNSSSRGSTSSQGSITSSEWPAPTSRGSITSSERSIAPVFIRNQDGDAAAITSPGAPTEEWVREWVSFIKQRPEVGDLNHHVHAVRIKNEAEDLELYSGVSFSMAISAIREAFKDQWQSVSEHAEQVLNDATYWHRKEAEEFRSSIFNAKNSALVDKINALPKVAAVRGSADAAVRKELKQIVRDVQSLPGIRPTRAAGNEGVALLQIANMLRNGNSPQEKAAGALVEDLRLQMMQQAGSITSSEGSIISSKLSFAADFISNEDGDAAAPVSLDAPTSITKPTEEWVNEWVNFIKQRAEVDNLDHRAHTVRIKNEAEVLELNDGVPFSSAISAIREAFHKEFKDQSQPVPEHAKQVLNDAIYWHRKETEAFRNAIFNGKNLALEEKINALSKLAAVPGDADDVLQEKLKQIVRDVQSLPGIRPTRAAGNKHVARLQIANMYRDRDSLPDKAVGALVEKLRLQMMQQTARP